MNQLYRIMTKGILIILIAAMVISWTGILFFPASSEEPQEAPKLTFSGLLDGSFFSGLQIYFSEAFPGKGYFSDRFIRFQNWYTLIDATEPSE